MLGVDDHGSSEWFVLSLVVVPKSEEQNIQSWIGEMIAATRSRQLRDIHFSKLSPSHKGAIVDLLATKPVMAFAICSNKKNMRRYRNPKAEAAMQVKDWYYCWLTRVALERATHFVCRRAIQKFNEPKYMKVVFSERGGLRVGQIGAYYHWISQQSSNDNLYLPWGDLEWDTIHRLLLSKDFHKNLAGLKLADIVAAAFFGACDNKQSGPCDPQFAERLMPIMGRYRNRSDGRYSGYGVKLLPSFGAAKLSTDQAAIFRHYGYPLQLWQVGKEWIVHERKKSERADQ